jgi:16S rRNA (guanine1207-N2)-methyltransferase
MSRWAEDPADAASQLIVSALADLALSGSVLLVDAAAATLAEARRRGLLSVPWSRRCDSDTSPEAVAAWPPQGRFDSALIRLPKTKSEFDMTLHAAVSVVRAEGPIFVYGGNDEGIKTIAKRMDDLTPGVETIAVRGHGRILRAIRPATPSALKPSLADWREVHTLALAGITRSWITYPGVFVDGAIDPGTALLLAHLPPLPDEARVLDFGCGSGVIAAHTLARYPRAQCTLVDNDTVALAAASENVPAARCVAGTSLAAAGRVRYDLVVSNPPLHVGTREDTRTLEALIKDAPRHLRPTGQLVMVVQRRIALTRSLESVFSAVSVLADDGRYRVWSATP